MALDRNYLSSLGLEIAKRKYYNAAKVEDVLESFQLNAAQLAQENSTLAQDNRELRQRLESLSYGREEIGDAILSAKTIAQQLIADAQQQADAVTAESVENAGALITAAQEKAERIVSEARERAEALVADAEAKRDAILAENEKRDHDALESVQRVYQKLRAQSLDSVKLLDREWQGFLCSLGDDEPAPPPALPEDLSEKLGELAESFSALEDEN